MVLPELKEEHYDEILEEASLKFRESSRGGPRGQLVTVYDDLDWWVMQVTRSYLQKMVDHEDALGNT